MQHCACLFNDGVYDIRGRIQSRGFVVAATEDIKYMQRHFVPAFDAEALKEHVNIIMNKNQVKDVLISFLKKFDQHPFNVVVGGQKYQIGEGAPLFTVTFHKDISLSALTTSTSIRRNIWKDCLP